MNIQFDVLESGVTEFQEKQVPEEVFRSHEYKISRKVRNILQKDGLFCLVRSEQEGYYTFPGGSVEEGESPVQGILRETLEETGASVENLRQVGQTREFRLKSGCLQITSYFESKAVCLCEPQLTKEEIALGTSLCWVDRVECFRLLAGQESPLYFRRFSGARDREFFRRYLDLQAGY